MEREREREEEKEEEEEEGKEEKDRQEEEKNKRGEGERVNYKLKLLENTMLKCILYCKCTSGSPSPLLHVGRGSPAHPEVKETSWIVLWLQMCEVCDGREGPWGGAAVDEGELGEGEELKIAETVANRKGADFGGKVEGSDGDGLGGKLFQWLQFSRIVNKVASTVEVCCGGWVEEGWVEEGRVEGRVKGGWRKEGWRKGGRREGGVRNEGSSKRGVEKRER